MAQGASAVDNRAVVGTGGEEAGVTHSGGGIDRNLVTSEGWGEGGEGIRQWVRDPGFPGPGYRMLGV